MVGNMVGVGGPTIRSGCLPITDDNPICRIGPPGNIGWLNQFPGSLNVYKFWLRLKAPVLKWTGSFCQLWQYRWHAKIKSRDALHVKFKHGNENSNPNLANPISIDLDVRNLSQPEPRGPDETLKFNIHQLNVICTACRGDSFDFPLIVKLCNYRHGNYNMYTVQF